MRIIPAAAPNYIYNGGFTGPVELEMLLQAASESEPDIARVTFSDGAVTKWHNHPGGQLLYLVEGTGRVGSEDVSSESLTPGILVETPANQRHWHGAAAGHDAVWLAVTWGTTCWEDEAPQ